MKYQASALLCVVVLLVIGVSDYAEGTMTPTTVYEIQQGSFTPGVDSVYVDSVLVTAVDRKTDTYGFHVQELAGGPWSGILCYLDIQYPIVNEGDLVTVWGQYDEYFDHSEIELVNANVIIIEPNYAEPACTLLSCEDLSHFAEADSDWAEKWEGVFICVDTVQVGGHGPYGEWSVAEYHDHPGENPADDSLRIDDKLLIPTMQPPDIGDTLALIKGVYAEEWGNYRVWPRSTDDLEFMGPAPGPNLVLAYAIDDTACNAIFDRNLLKSSAEDETNYSFDGGMPIKEAQLYGANPKAVKIITTLPMPNNLDSLVACDIYSEDGYPMEGCQKYGFITGIAPMSYVQQVAHPGTDSSHIEAEQVTVRGVVTSASASFGGPFFMQDAIGPWNGIYVYYPAGTFNLLDSITVSGVVDEYYGWTEITSVDWTTTHGTSGITDWASVVTPAAMQDSATAESYEDVLVTMEDVEVYSYLLFNGEFDVGIGTDTVRVGDFVNDVPPNPPDYDYPGLGSVIDITGCWRYHYEYQIEPRDSGDIVIVDPCPAGVKVSDSRVPHLYQNAPNPFASGTVIRFSVPSKMMAKVAVYDVSGRLVNVVTDGVADPGEHRVIWDGRDSRGARVSPGIYFYQLTTPGTMMQRKMVHLK